MRSRPRNHSKRCVNTYQREESGQSGRAAAYMKNPRRKYPTQDERILGDRTQNSVVTIYKEKGGKGVQTIREYNF